MHVLKRRVLEFSDYSWLSPSDNRARPWLQQWRTCLFKLCFFLIVTFEVNSVPVNQRYIHADGFCDNNLLCELQYVMPGIYTFERINKFVERITISGRFYNCVIDLKHLPSVTDVILGDVEGIPDSCQVIINGCANVTVSDPTVASMSEDSKTKWCCNVCLNAD